jgi:hypothetical protein
MTKTAEHGPLRAQDKNTLSLRCARMDVEQIWRCEKRAFLQIDLRQKE